MTDEVWTGTRVYSDGKELMRSASGDYRWKPCPVEPFVWIGTLKVEVFTDLERKLATDLGEALVILDGLSHLIRKHSPGPFIQQFDTLMGKYVTC